MTRKIALYMICLAVLVGMLSSAVASAEIVVGVKQGDWIEYNVTVTGNVPEEHNVTRSKIEIISVEGKKLYIKITSIYSNGTKETVTSNLNLETGQIGDAFIIPANLDNGDAFLKNEDTITISGVEERTYAGANRNVVYATTLQTMFYWDRSTGVIVEATSSYPDFTLATKAEKTNMWQTQASALDPLFSIVVIVLVIVAVLAILLRHKKKK